MNPFIVAGTALYIGASIWEAYYAHWWKALVFFAYAVANIGIMML